MLLASMIFFSTLGLCVSTWSQVVDSNFSNKGVELMETYSLFSEPKQILKVEFSRLDLTYIHSDMGPETAIWPWPVLMKPSKGLWIMDRGKNLRSWRLIKVNLKGDVVFSKDVIEKLKISQPQEFSPIIIHNDSDYEVTLLASRGIDFKKDRYKDFILAVFSGSGDLQSFREIPNFKYADKAFVLKESILLNLENTQSVPAWFIYKGDNKKEQLIGTILGSTPVEVDGFVIERLSESDYRKLDSTDGSTAMLKLIGQATSGSEPVSGEGSFFGFIKFGTYELNASDQMMQGAREIEILYIDKNNSSILNLGNSKLLPTKYSEVDPDDFILYWSNQSRFDFDGNLFELAWSPSSLTLYRYELNQSLVKQIVGNLKNKYYK